MNELCCGIFRSRTATHNISEDRRQWVALTGKRDKMDFRFFILTPARLYAQVAQLSRAQP
jgi:hypothetical protein